MHATTTDDDGISIQQAWRILAEDLLDTVSDLLTELSVEAQAEITNLLQRNWPGNDTCTDLANRAKNVADNLDSEN